MPETSIKHICEKILELEDKYDLLNKDIEGVKVWQFLRFVICQEIAQKCGIYGQAHTTEINKNILSKIKSYYGYLYNSIAKNPLLWNYEKNILISEHPRKVFVEEKYIDIYTNYLIEKFRVDEYEILEMGYLGKHFSKKEPTRKYLDILNFILFFSKELHFYDVKFTNSDIEWIDNVEKEIRDYFNIELNIKDMFIKWIPTFKVEYKFYDSLIKKRKYSRIYLVVYYSTHNIPLIAAAKANNVETIEIQHGTISPYHIAYNFPIVNHKLEYLPDRFYLFGNYWREVSNFPIDKENFVIYGFPYLKEKTKKYKGKQKVPKQIIFISQGTIGKELSKFAYQAAKNLKSYKIIYKLHPGEYDRWKDEYEELLQASKLDNVEVVDNNHREFYEYLAESEFQIGVYSTAIFEGLTFKCKTLLFDLPGIEYMDYLIEKGIAKKICDVEELENELNNFTGTQYDMNYFFSMYPVNSTSLNNI